MPIDTMDISLLIGGIILFIIPGYLLSHVMLKELLRLERVVFGFILTLCFFVLTFFIGDLLLQIPITATKTVILYVLYFTGSIILYGYRKMKSNDSKIAKPHHPLVSSYIKHPLQTITNQKQIIMYTLLISILIFAAFMGFLPHLKDGYFLPFHVDEWFQWTYTKSFMETGSTAFTYPYLGTGNTQSLEPGFNYFIASLAWLTGVSFNTLFLFVPTILTVFSSIIVFTLGNRQKEPFGLEAAFFITFIPTTCRMLGPSFFVPLTLGLFLLVFYLWFLQTKKTMLYTLMIPLLLWTIFLIHPPTALAAMIVTFLFALMTLFEKQYTQSVLYMIYALFPLVGIFLLTTRYGSSLQQVIDAFLGGKFFFDYNLPEIWVSFEQMSTLLWVFALIGVFYSIVNGKGIIRTMSLSALCFLVIIGLYNKLGYGLPIMYERSFMYLFIMISLLAGWGLASLRRFIQNLSEYHRLLPNQSLKQYVSATALVLPFIIAFLLISTSVPAHVDISYYHLIDETDYESFTWINEHLDYFRNNSHPLEKGAVDPFKASPFSAITRLSIVSSTMHPIPGYQYHKEVSTFLKNGCMDELFLEKFNVSVVYNQHCVNQNLTQIFPNVYLYL